MDPAKILFIYKMSRLDHDQQKLGISKENLINYYQKNGIEYQRLFSGHEAGKATLKELQRYFPTSTFISSYQLSDQLFHGKELIVTFGGDELLKIAVQRAPEVKFLSICADPINSEGALCIINNAAISQLASLILADQYAVTQWTRIKCLLNNEEISSAIDTIYIGSRYAPSISYYQINYNGISERQKSSGILIATGAGSTGWFASAGGTKFGKQDQQLRFIVREAYRGRKVDWGLLHGKINQNDQLEVTSLMHEEIGTVNIDYIKNYSLRRGDKLTISVSERTLKMIKPMF